MYRQKVLICGVDTANLPVLKQEEKQRLLQRAQNGDYNARDLMVRGNLRLVLSVIQRFSSRSENPDDLFQVGVIGLLKAIDHFDLSQEVRFSTYAVPMIIGEIRRFLRDNSPVRVSRSIKDTAYHAMQIKESLMNRCGREPTVGEIADALKLPREEVVIALESIVEPISLYDPVFSDGGDPIFVMDQLGDNNDDENWLNAIAFRDAMKALSEREKKIMTLRFLKGKTQMEVSQEIGISQAQVSRLEKGVLQKIRAQ